MTARVSGVGPLDLLTREQVRAYLRCSREKANAVVSGLTPVCIGLDLYVAGEVLKRARDLSKDGTVSSPAPPARRRTNVGKLIDDVV